MVVLNMGSGYKAWPALFFVYECS